MENWVAKSISENLRKKSSSLSSIKDNDGIVWFASGNSEENVIDIYIENGDNFSFYCDIEGDENFGSHVKLLLLNNKLYLAVTSRTDLFIFEYNDTEWNKDPVKKYSFEKRIDGLEFDSVLFIKQNKSLKYINVVDGNFGDDINDIEIEIENIFAVKYLKSYHLATLAPDRTKVYIYNSDDLKTWEKIKEYRINDVKHLSFGEDINDKLWLVVSDKLNIKLFSYNLDKKKWANFYDILFHNEVALKKTVLNIDNSGKAWIVSCDSDNKINVYKKDEELMELKNIKQIECKNNIEFDIVFNKSDDLILISENLLNHDKMSLSKKKRKNDNNKKTGEIQKINKSVELINKAAENEEFELNIDLILQNHNETEIQFVEFYKFLFNIILEAIEKNKYSEEYNKYIGLIKKIFGDSILVNKNVLDINYNIYKCKKNGIYFDFRENIPTIKTLDNKNYLLNEYDEENDKIITEIYNNDDCAKALVIRDNKLVLLDWIDKENGDKLSLNEHITLHNYSENKIRLFTKDTNIELEENNSIEFKDLNKFEIFIKNKFDVKDKKVSIIENNDRRLYNANFMTIGFVTENNLNAYPSEYENLDFDEKKYITIRFNDKNYFPDGTPNSEIKISNLKNISLDITSRRATEHMNITNQDQIIDMVLSGEVTLNDFLHVDLKSYFDIDEEDTLLEWKTANDETVDFQAFVMNSIFYNKTPNAINIIFNMIATFEEINFILDKKTLVYGKIEDSSTAKVNSYKINEDCNENGIIDIFNNSKNKEDLEIDTEACFCGKVLEKIRENNNIKVVIESNKNNKKMVKFNINNNGPYMFTCDHPFIYNGNTVSTGDLIRMNENITNFEYVDGNEDMIIYNIAKSKNLNENIFDFEGLKMLGATINNDMWKIINPDECCGEVKIKVTKN